MNRYTHPVPKVGDIVVFNDYGLEQVFNCLPAALAPMKKHRMRITFVDNESMTEPEPTYVVNVDDKAINSYLIDHLCFDIVN